LKNRLSRMKIVFVVVILISLLDVNIGGFLPLWAQENSDGDLIPKKASDKQAVSSPISPTANDSKSPTEPSESSLGLIVLVMLVGGLILLFIEVALIPGFGITGVTGILVILAGLGIAFWKLDFKLAVIYTIVSLVGLVLLVLWAIYIFPHTKLGKQFVLQTTISVEDGFTATRDFTKYVGMEGVATSDLRPSGIVRIDDERLDVMSEGEFVPRGTKIKVSRVKNGSLVVVPFEQSKT